MTTLRFLAAATLLAVGVGVAPPAHALDRPVIDGSRLPAPAAPAPPTATRQRQTCAVPPDHRGPATAANAVAMLGLDAAWNITRGQGQRVAVIDTGVARHPRLARLEGAGDYVGIGDGTQDCDGHGTIVAGIIAAAPDSADGVGFAGIAPEATVLSIRQSSTKFGPAHDATAVGFGDVETLAMAVRTAADQGATVINISSVACRTGALEDRALGAALAYAVDVKDAVVVTAAGNVGGAAQCPPQPADGAARWDSATVAVSPAWYDDYVLTVGSVDADGAASAFTLAGPWVDVGAPGEHLISLNPAGGGVTATLPTPDGDRPLSGTSYAAPVVSGLAALIRSRFPELRARQVMHRIETSAQRPGHGWDPAIGNGVIDPLRALDGEPITAAPSAEALGRPIEPERRSGRDPDARTAALLGAGGCAVVLLAASTLPGRRRGSHDVVGHQRGRPTQGRARR